MACRLPPEPPDAEGPSLEVDDARDAEEADAADAEEAEAAAAAEEEDAATAADDDDAAAAEDAAARDDVTESANVVSALKSVIVVKEGGRATHGLH